MFLKLFYFAPHQKWVRRRLTFLIFGWLSVKTLSIMKSCSLKKIMRKMRNQFEFDGKWAGVGF